MRVDASKLQSEIYVNNWQILGPFGIPANGVPAEERNAGLDIDLLAPFGYSESHLDPVGWHSACQKLASTCKTVLQTKSDLDLLSVFPGVQFAAVYLATTVYSSSTAQLYISAGSDDGIRLWVNGEELISTPTSIRRPLKRFDNIAPVTLRQGSNFLVAKVDQKVGGWALSVGLYPPDLLRSKSAEDHFRDPIQNRILSDSHHLDLNFPLWPLGTPVQVSIRDQLGRTRKTASLLTQETNQLAVDGLASGIYDCAFTIGHTDLRDSFYLGEPEDTMKHVKLWIKNAEQKHEVSLRVNLTALTERYAQLYRPGYHKKDDPAWQKKVLYVLRESESALRSGSKLDWLRVPGTHLRGFVSQIDGQPQFYLIHVPPGPPASLPFAIMMPGRTLWPQPFLEGGHLFDPDHIAKMARIADSYGTGFAIIDGRGNRDDAPIGRSDALEVIEDVAAYYPLDRERLYLMGECEGTRRAISMAEHYPGMFAAVGTYGPLTTPYWTPETGKYWSPPDFDLAKQWSATHESAVALAPNLRNIPLLLLAGDEDDVAPPEIGGPFIKAANAAGVSLQFTVLHNSGHLYYSHEPIDLFLKFFSGKTRDKSPQRLTFVVNAGNEADQYSWIRVRELENPLSPATIDASRTRTEISINTVNVRALELTASSEQPSNQRTLHVRLNGEGLDLMQQQSGPVMIDVSRRAVWASSRHRGLCCRTIADVVAQPFVFVVGQEASPVRKASAVKAAEGIATVWRNDFFVPCRIKAASELSNDDLKHFNLVLIGGNLLEPTQRSLLERLPLKLTGSQVQLAGKKFDGSHLGIEAVLPNPLNPDHSILLINANSDEWTLPVPSLSDARNGYRIWDTTSNVVLDIGFIDAWDETVASLVANSRG